MDRCQGIVVFILCAVAVVRHDRLAPVVGERLLHELGRTDAHGQISEPASALPVPISYRELADEILGAVWLEVAVYRPSLVLASPCDPTTGDSSTLTAAGLRQGTFAA